MAIEQYVSDSRMMAWEKNKTGLRDKERVSCVSGTGNEKA